MLQILTNREKKTCSSCIKLPEVVGVGTANQSVVWLVVIATLTGVDRLENMDTSSDGLKHWAS